MQGPRAALLTTARSLAVDGVCVEVVRAWRAQDIDAVLLKGATTAAWLYPDTPRGYTDADLLVAPDRRDAAGDILSRLGFVPAPAHVSDHAHPWIRPRDDAVVDLHATVWGPSRDPEAVWRELQRWLVGFTLAGDVVPALSLPARALHITLHAAQHRDSPRQPDDLRRLLQRATLEHWRGAEMLADRLWALWPLATGLTLEPEGERVLAHLPLARAAAAGECEGARLAVGFARLSAARGPRAKVAVIVTAVRTGVHADDPTAARKWPARAIAYLRRATWMAAHAPATAVALRRRRARQPADPRSGQRPRASRGSVRRR